MSSRDDGGPAFPEAGRHGGMTLRDYFAGQAIIGFLASEGAELDDRKPEKDLAAICYRVADALLVEREK